MSHFVDDHDRFVTAQALRAEIKNLVSDKEHTIVTHLVSQYREGKLEPFQALAGVSEISGLRSLLRTVETEYKRSLRSVEKATSGR